MALTDENSMVMPVAPMYAQGGGFGTGFGGDWGWIILLLLIAGNGFGFGGFGGGGFAADGAMLYPWMNQSEVTTNGFRDQMINSNINSIRDGIGDISTQLCNGFAGVNAGVANGFAQAEIAANGRQMANMNQTFGLQTAMAQGFNGVQGQLAANGSDTRMGIADLKYTVATENCADRTQSMQNTRDIIDAQTRGTQAILDKLCALELDGVKGQLAAAQRENVGLQNQLNMANLAASQSAQNTLIQQGFANEVDALYNRLSNCPVPSTPVYGRTPIFTCNNNSGCGCGA